MDWSCGQLSVDAQETRQGGNEHTSSSVKRLNGQKSSSSSNSKLFAASMRCRYSEYAGGSGMISLTLRCALNCLCAFCEVILGPLRLRPWWPWELCGACDGMEG